MLERIEPFEEPEAWLLKELRPCLLNGNYTRRSEELIRQLLRSPYFDRLVIDSDRCKTLPIALAHGTTVALSGADHYLEFNLFERSNLSIKAGRDCRELFSELTITALANTYDRYRGRQCQQEIWLQTDRDPDGGPAVIFLTPEDFKTWRAADWIRIDHDDLELSDLNRFKIASTPIAR